MERTGIEPVTSACKAARTGKRAKPGNDANPDPIVLAFIWRSVVAADNAAWKIEREVIARLGPPLNSAGNAAHARDNPSPSPTVKTCRECGAGPPDVQFDANRRVCRRWP